MGREGSKGENKSSVCSGSKVHTPEPFISILSNTLQLHNPPCPVHRRHYSCWSPRGLLWWGLLCLLYWRSSSTDESLAFATKCSCNGQLCNSPCGWCSTTLCCKVCFSFISYKQTPHYTISRGIRLYYLPPYSPDYNPIEEAFSYVKTVIRRKGDEVRAAVEAKNDHAHFFFLHKVLAMITPDMVEGWMGHSGYVSVLL